MEESAQADVYVATDEGESDAERPEVEVLLPQRLADVFSV